MITTWITHETPRLPSEIWEARQSRKKPGSESSVSKKPEPRIPMTIEKRYRKSWVPVSEPRDAFWPI